MAVTIQSEDTLSPLVQYVKEVYEDQKNARRAQLEDDWDLSYDAFKGNYSESNLKKWRRMEGSHWRSQVFVRITKRKVVAATSQVNDILLQGGDALPFNTKPTPVPVSGGQVLPEEVATERAVAMNLRLKDHLIQCKWDRTLMTSVLEGALYGICVQKSPIVRTQRKMRYRYEVPLPGPLSGMAVPAGLLRKFGRHTPYIANELMPKVEAPNLWDIFWDLEYEDPQQGRAIIHRQKITPARLREMAGKRSGWKMDAVEAVIKQASSRETTTDESEGPARRDLTKRTQSIELLEYWGRVPDKAMKDEFAGDVMDRSKEVEILVLVANEKVVFGAVVNPLPGELRPFHFGYWEKMPHEAKGIGIPLNIRDSQMMINSGVRCFIDNKALSGNVLTAINEGALDATTTMSVYPGKIFKFKQGVGRVADAIQYFSPPDVGRGLLELVNLFERFADEESGIPKLMQGETSESDPQTAYAYSRLIEAGNKQMGNVIRNFDEGIIEPVVESLYHYLMAFDPDESIKGDQQIQALGFASYVDRVTRGNNMAEFMQIMLSQPILARLLKPAPMARDIAKSKDLDVDKFIKTDEELEAEAAELAKQMAERQAMEGLAEGEAVQEDSLPPELQAIAGGQPQQPPLFGGSHGA